MIELSQIKQVKGGSKSKFKFGINLELYLKS